MNYKHKYKKKKQVTYVILTTTTYTYEVPSFKLSIFIYLSFIPHTTTKASIIIPSLRLGKLIFREIR